MNAPAKNKEVNTVIVIFFFQVFVVTGGRRPLETQREIIFLRSSPIFLLFFVPFVPLSPLLLFPLKQ